MANPWNAIAKYVSDFAHPDKNSGSSVSSEAEYDKIVDAIYKPDYSKNNNWLKSAPYAFQANIEGKQRTFYLPISPQNLTISTYFATNTIATLYGTVEEHSEQRYFDIAIQGTTGFSPAFYDQNQQIPSAGRESFASTAFMSSSIYGFASGLIGKLNKAAQQAKDIYKSISGTTDGQFQAGVSVSRSGYAAFHNLYRFLLAHKKYASSGKMSANIGSENLNDLSKDPTPLYFINFKDNNKYSCVVQRFTLERSANQPMLYNYNIQLRAYNISPAVAPTVTNVAAARLTALGLDGSTASIASSFKGAVSNSKGLLNTLKNIRGI
jgi:hypothetical protein